MTRLTRGTVRAGLVTLVVVAALVATPVVSAHGNQVSASTQHSADGIVRAELVHTITSAWLVVHRDADGSVGEPIGHTSVVASTVRTDVPVEIESAAWETWGTARQVHLVVHNDDGDGTFEPADDPPLTRGGQPIASEITVAKADSRAYVGAETIRTRESSGNFTVRRVVAPQNGYLVAHSRSTSGAVGGYTAVPAGSSDNVTIHLNDSFLRQRPALATLTFALYADDGDGEFDRQSDTVVSAGDSPVASTVDLRINTSALATTTTVNHGDDHEHTGTDYHDGTGTDHHDGTGTDHHDGTETTIGASSSPTATSATSSTPSPGPVATTTTTGPSTTPTTTSGSGAGLGVPAALLALVGAVVVRRR